LYALRNFTCFNRFAVFVVIQWYNDAIGKELLGEDG